MRKFAFLLNLSNLEQIRQTWPLARFLPYSLTKFLFDQTKNFKILQINKIKSILNKEIEGYIILLPVLAQNADKTVLLNKINSAIPIVQRLKVDLLGIDGYLSTAINDNNSIAKKFKIPVTTGNAFVAWSIFEAVYRTAKTKKINLSQTSIAILGANTPIGLLCSKKFCELAKKIYIIDENTAKLQSLKSTLNQINNIEIVSQPNIYHIPEDIDIIIDTNLQQSFLAGRQDLKANSIVCSIAAFQEKNNKTYKRNDLTVIDGGLIKLPYPAKLKLNGNGANEIIDAFLAETMLLTFEEKLINYSLGEDINIDKLEEIANISARHGFQVWVPEAPV